jgi:hypothetical protein
MSRQQRSSGLLRRIAVEPLAGLEGLAVYGGAWAWQLSWIIRFGPGPVTPR